MVNSFLNTEEKGEELLQEFISRFTIENFKLKYNDPIKRQKVYTSEMPQPKDTNRSITEDEKESFGQVLLSSFSQMHCSILLKRLRYQYFLKTVANISL